MERDILNSSLLHERFTPSYFAKNAKRSQLATAYLALAEENERLRYVLGGVRNAIKTGRNEPLVAWSEQIDIALAAYRATEGQSYE